MPTRVETLEEKVDKLLEDIHGKGCFSLFSFLAIVFGMNATGWWFYILSYLIVLPQYKDCVFTDPQPADPSTACNADNICNGTVISYEVDWDNINSLHNWVEKLDLTCEPGWKIGMLGSTVFIGWCATLPWLPRLSDVYSRKYIFMGGMFADLCLYIALFFTTSLDWMIVVTTCFGLVTTVRCNIGYVYMMELLPRRL